MGDLRGYSDLCLTLRYLRSYLGHNFFREIKLWHTCFVPSTELDNGMERLITWFLKELTLGEMTINQHVQEGCVSVSGRHTCGTRVVLST